MVVVGASSRVEISLYQPPVKLSQNLELEVWIDGERQKERVFFPLREHGINSQHYAPHQRCPLVLVSRDVKGDFQQKAEEVLIPAQSEEKSIGSPKSFVPGMSSAVVMPCEAVRAELSTSTWSTNWLGYTCYDGIILTRADVEGMSGPVYEAISRYVECGGSVAVVGGGEVPEAWGEGQATQGAIGSYEVGFGEYLVVEEGDLDGWNMAIWSVLKQSWDETAEPWRYIKSREMANRVFPVVEDMQIPLRGMFVLILAFALLIGPLNIVFFSKKGRRMRLFWTVPLLSLVTSAGILVYSLLSEGIHGKSRLETITILDERSHRASTIGLIGYYSPLTPSGGLRFSYETELTPQTRDARSWDEEDSRLTVDWTNGQDLTSGWIRARIPTHFMVRKSETRRERLLVREDGNRVVTVVNGLGGRITSLFVADSEGRIHTGGDIETGAQAQLRAGPLRCSSRSESLRQLYGLDWTMILVRITEAPEAYLSPGTYLAQIDGAVFVEEGLEGGGERNQTTVVYGITRGADDEG